MVLVDTSVWIDVFRAGRFLPDHLAVEEIATCPPIIQEVLNGARDEWRYRQLRVTLFATRLLDAPMSLDIFEEAAQLYRRCRASGYTIRSSMDCLIAACALRNGIPLLQRDRDFEHIARISPLALF